MPTQTPPPILDADDALPDAPSPGPFRGPLRGRWALLAFLVVLGLVWALAPGRVPSDGDHIGAWSLLPAASALLLVFLTRQIIASLLVGVIVGGLITGQLNIVNTYLLPSIASSSYATILLVYLWALGGLIGIWTRTGGARVFAEWAGDRMVRGPRTARLFAWMMGVVFHQGGTISTILAGTTVRPIADQRRVSHEELTYIVDSTASPVATVIPFNAWPLYIAGLIAGTTPLFATEPDAVAFFFRSLPYNFYGILALVSTLLFALGLLPWTGGKMARAIARARETGQLDAPGAEPLASAELSDLRVPDGYRGTLLDFVLPIGVLLGVAIIPYFLTGTVRIAEAFTLAVVTAVIVALAKGMALRDVMDGFVDGCKGVTAGAIILGLAVTLGNVAKDVGTAAFIVDLVSGIVSAAALPALLTIVCMLVAFSIGSSWGTYAVVFPVAMPLAYAVSPDPFFVSVCFGAVLGGAVFGDQCSPISDTTILTSVACGADLIDHVTTQLPLALVAAAIGVVLSTVLVVAR